jgi:hypothetical protein
VHVPNHIVRARVNLGQLGVYGRPSCFFFVKDWQFHVALSNATAALAPMCGRNTIDQPLRADPDRDTQNNHACSDDHDVGRQPVRHLLG